VVVISSASIPDWSVHLLRQTGSYRRKWAKLHRKLLNYYSSFGIPQSLAHLKFYLIQRSTSPFEIRIGSIVEMFAWTMFLKMFRF
jgi:hypothetical protein